MQLLIRELSHSARDMRRLLNHVPAQIPDRGQVIATLKVSSTERAAKIQNVQTVIVRGRAQQSGKKGKVVLDFVESRRVALECGLASSYFQERSARLLQNFRRVVTG